MYAEIQTLENDIEEKKAEKTTRDIFNVIWVVGGVFVIVPFFFMDLKGSHEAEIEAFEDRQKQMKIFFADKGCSVADLEASTVRVSDTNLEELQGKKEKLFDTKNCSECNSALQKEDGINIYQSKRLCAECFKGITSKESKTPNMEVSNSGKIKTQCPHCEATFNAKKEYQGMKTKCKKCEQVFTINEWAPELLSLSGSTGSALRTGVYN
ncbi:MAG: zinc ribbon domain-containing protein [Planctomycetota bacterium]|jgi:predicted Zn finger-like uncharacterized protein